jgi:hypothetical protein
MDEETIFEAEYRAAHQPSRKPVVLRAKIKATGKQKLANSSRFQYRTQQGIKAKNSGQSKKWRTR